ncbi:AGAP007319-PA [Anopheles gambiae str. PEST]|uniref:AGAP007319-PA n=1 Tax=Anopheles gambiae TaxID=7165 RepID=A7URG9_ANOGA|nr:AGAP007319-PA [Anopheles gambiae str. PEST]
MGWPVFLNFRKNIRTHAAFVCVILILYAIFSILTGVAWWLELKVQTGSDKIDYEVKADAYSQFENCFLRRVKRKGLIQCSRHSTTRSTSITTRRSIRTTLNTSTRGSAKIPFRSSNCDFLVRVCYRQRQQLFLVIFIGLMTFAVVALSIGMFIMIQQLKFIWACAMLFGFVVNGYVLMVALQLHSNFKFTRRRQGYGTEVCVLPLK